MQELFINTITKQTTNTKLPLNTKGAVSLKSEAALIFGIQKAAEILKFRGFCGIINYDK